MILRIDSDADTAELLEPSGWTLAHWIGNAVALIGAAVVFVGFWVEVS